MNGRFGAYDDWRVAPPVRAEDPSDPEIKWAAERRHPQARACFEEKVTLSKPLEEQPFGLTYIVASERPDPGAFFDQTAERLRGNPQWTVHQMPGAHNMTMTHPRELTDLLLELFAVPVAASAR